MTPETWSLGARQEIAHWEGWLRSKGEGCGSEYADRFDPAFPLQGELSRFLPTEGPVHILDVGAGPATTIGKVWPGHDVRIVAIDPLAVEYARLLASLGRSPPVLTGPCRGEDVADLFPADYFDLTHARNSLDHSVDPISVIEAMVRVTKPGGVVYLSHAIREADRQQRQGLHQWNLYPSDGCLWVDGVSVSALFHGRAIVTIDQVVGEEWFVATLRKKDPR